VKTKRLALLAAPLAWLALTPGPTATADSSGTPVPLDPYLAGGHASCLHPILGPA